MTRLLVALLILTAAVTGLAMTARAQQETPPAEGEAPEQGAPEQIITEDVAPEQMVPADPTSEPVVPVPVVIAPSPSPSPSPCKPDRILVKVKPGADPAAVIGRHGGTIIQTIPGIDVQIVNVPHGTGQQVIDALNADPDVQYAEPDGVVRISSEGSDGC